MEVTFKYILGADLELIVGAYVSLGRPAKTYGEPEDCYPAEDAEAEIESVSFVTWEKGAKAVKDFEIDDIDVAGEPLINILKELAIAEACENE